LGSRQVCSARPYAFFWFFRQLIHLSLSNEFSLFVTVTRPARFGLSARTDHVRTSTKQVGENWRLTRLFRKRPFLSRWFRLRGLRGSNSRAAGHQATRQRVGKAAARRDVGGLEPDLHRVDQRQRLCLSHVLPGGGRLAADGGLDRIDLGDAPQRFSRDRREPVTCHITCGSREPGRRQARYRPIRSSAHKSRACSLPVTTSAWLRQRGFSGSWNGMRPSEPVIRNGFRMWFFFQEGENLGSNLLHVDQRTPAS